MIKVIATTTTTTKKNRSGWGRERQMERWRQRECMPVVNACECVCWHSWYPVQMHVEDRCWHKVIFANNFSILFLETGSITECLIVSRMTGHQASRFHLAKSPVFALQEPAFRSVLGIWTHVPILIQQELTHEASPQPHGLGFDHALFHRYLVCNLYSI